MKKAAWLTLLGICMALQGFAQNTDAEDQLKTVKTDTILGWKKGGSVSLNLSQTSLTNWSAGGQNSVAVNSLISLFAQLKTEKSLWENYLDVGYGTLKQGDASNWWKTDDKLDFTSKYGLALKEKLYLAALVNFKSQFFDGFDYPNDSVTISTFLAPAYLVGAVGLDYKPSENLTFFIAPLTSKLTIVADEVLANAGAFGVDPAELDNNGEILKSGKQSRMEFGGYVRLFGQMELLENIGAQSKLDIFSNYLDNPLNLDINWETLIILKVNKYISGTINTHLIYDHDIKIADSETGETNPKVQFKEIVGFGLTLKF